MFDRFWKDWNRILQDIDRDFEDMFKRSIEELSNDPESTRTWGFKLYWDNSMENPVVKYFGNVNPTTGKLLEEGWTVPPIEKTFDTELHQWRIIIELPGVKKQEIKLTTTNTFMNLETTSKKWKYRSRIDFDQEIDPESVKAKFNNGILEITVKDKTPPTSEAKDVPIG